MNLINIAIAEAKAHISTMEKADVVEVLKAAMKITKHHWLVTDELSQIQAAVGATMLHFGVDSEEWNRLKTEMSNINQFNVALLAMEQGIEVNLESVLKSHETIKPIGIMRIWKEVEISK